MPSEMRLNLIRSQKTDVDTNTVFFFIALHYIHEDNFVITKLYFELVNVLVLIFILKKIWPVGQVNPYPI